MRYDPRPQFLPFHLRDKRWAIIVAHRRAGKTVACVVELITRALACKRPNGRYGYIAPFYSQAKQAAWMYLKAYAQPLMVEEARESELSVKLYNGSVIRLYGADNPNSLRGTYFDGVILDEFADMKPSVWGEVIRPTLSDRNGWGVFIGTPKGKNAFWDIWETARKETSTWFRLELKASQTKIIPDHELADARKSQTEDEYEQEYECSFDAAIKGAIYGKLMREAMEGGRIKSVPVDQKLPVHTAWDLGFDDSTAIWFWQITYGEIRLVDYYENNGQPIEHYCEVITQRGYTYDRHWVPHDAANELLAAGGRSIVQQAWGLGIKMSVVPATSQQNSIEAARVTIPRCWFDEAHCEKGIEALRQYQFEYDEEKKAFKGKPRHDWSSHASDAFEIIARVWKTPNEQKPKPEPKFLHNMTFNDLIAPPKNTGRPERI